KITGFGRRILGGRRPPLRPRSPEQGLEKQQHFVTVFGSVPSSPPAGRGRYGAFSLAARFWYSQSAYCLSISLSRHACARSRSFLTLSNSFDRWYSALACSFLSWL